MTLTIFLVEDNSTIRDNLTATLQEMVGAQVLAVAAGEREARTWLAENNAWAIAVVDLFIENGSGLGVLKALQKRSHQQRALILSNYATAEIRAQCLRLGADRVFDKSTELETFIDYLATLHSSK
jgi:DNA-binding NarL/FixJ family response regulator